MTQPSRYARTGDSRIAYELRGRLCWWRPWLVLIQGMGMDRFGWQPELGHLLFWEDPDRFTDTVTAFLLTSGRLS